VLIDALDAYHGTLCFITHDRTVIREVANKIIEIRSGVPLVYQGNYDEYLAWREGLGSGHEETVAIKSDSFKDNSPRELQRQRKIAEGELRNTYYRESSPLKKRIGVIENDLAKLETEYRGLEAYFSTPENYGDSAKITASTIRHHELKKIIGQLSEEWEKLSLDAEQKKQEYETAKMRLEM